MHINTHTHTLGAGTRSIVAGGKFNPDLLSSEAGELYGTSGSRLYGVDRISSSICRILR